LVERQKGEFMSSKRGYDCEILSFVVLFVLSALSHFWYIMIFICAGIAVWGTGAILTRISVNWMTVCAPEFRARMLHRVLGPGGPSSSSGAPNTVQPLR